MNKRPGPLTDEEAAYLVDKIKCSNEIPTTIKNLGHAVVARLMESDRPEFHSYVVAVPAGNTVETCNWQWVSHYPPHTTLKKLCEEYLDFDEDHWFPYHMQIFDAPEPEQA